MKDGHHEKESSKIWSIQKSAAMPTRDQTNACHPTLQPWPTGTQFQGRGVTQPWTATQPKPSPRLPPNSIPRVAWFPGKPRHTGPDRLL